MEKQCNRIARNFLVVFLKFIIETGKINILSMKEILHD